MLCRISSGAVTVPRQAVPQAIQAALTGSLAIFQASSVLILNENSYNFFFAFISKYLTQNLTSSPWDPSRLSSCLAYTLSKTCIAVGLCPAWLFRANQSRTTPAEIKIPRMCSAAVDDFCMNEVLQIYLVILIDLTNFILEQNLLHC